MGSKISDLLEGEEIEITQLKGKILAVDGFNALYMFLTTIRGPDGSPLMDSKGNITSHIQGLLSRFLNYMQQGLKFVFVFDGEAPELKSEETKRRKELKEEARKLYEKAKDTQNIENMKKYAARTVFLTPKMVEETKELLNHLGIPYVQAPSEGEAQAAYLVNKGDAYAVVSQDVDSLLNGAERVVKNLSITGRRKLPGNLGYKNITPELIDLNKNLNELELDIDELIKLAILIGTDYNYGGIKGIGPKKGYKLIKNKGDDSFKEAKWNKHFEIDWQEIYDTIKHMPINTDYVLEWKQANIEQIKIFLEKRDFSEVRIDNILKKIEEVNQNNKQKGLGEFF